MDNKLPDAIEERIEAICEDSETGATELAVRGAEILRDLLDSEGDREPQDVFTLLCRAGLALVQGQPVMAPLLNLVNQLLLEAEGARESRQIASCVIHACNAFMQQTDEQDQHLQRKAAGIIRDQDTVLSHSYSSAVAKALITARRQGKSFSVICTESRPVLEGRSLALELSEAGIPVRFITDAAVGLFMAEADVVMVGADNVSQKGLVNKIGTFPLTVTAQAMGIDVYGLCTTLKFIPGNLVLPPQTQRSGDEIWDSCPGKIEAVNLYFDVTPLKYVTGIITENGAQKAEQVLAQIQSLPVHPALRDTLDELSSQSEPNQ